jgi:hypothetical protein
MPSTLGIVASAKRNPPPFNPGSIAGLAGWWDAAALALTDGVSVTSWPDRSGNARHMTLKSGSVGPTFKTAVQNGKAVARFSGSNQAMQAAATAVTPKQVFAVGFHAGATFANYNGMFSGTNSADYEIIYTGGAGTGSWYSPSSPPSAYYYNGVSNGAFSAPMNVWAVMSLQWAIWTVPILFQIGEDRGSARYWNGDVGEILVYDRVLSTVERQQVEQYLKQKWNTP